MVTTGKVMDLLQIYKAVFTGFDQIQTLAALTTFLPSFSKELLDF
jgi:hypothetical protein